MDKAALREALDAIDDFIADAVRCRNEGEPGQHWPEWVWGDELGAAIAGLETLRSFINQKD